jgi:hypothetical protein
MRSVGPGLEAWRSKIGGRITRDISERSQLGSRPARGSGRSPRPAPVRAASAARPRHRCRPIIITVRSRRFVSRGPDPCASGHPGRSDQWSGSRDPRPARERTMRTRGPRRRWSRWACAGRRDDPIRPPGWRSEERTVRSWKDASRRGSVRRGMLADRRGSIGVELEKSDLPIPPGKFPPPSNPPYGGGYTVKARCRDRRHGTARPGP